MQDFIQWISNPLVYGFLLMMLVTGCLIGLMLFMASRAMKDPEDEPLADEPVDVFRWWM